jgi:hypothetical protein
MGAEVIKVITAHFNKTGDMDAPSWAREITVPGANVHDEQIAELTRRMEDLAVQVTALQHVQRGPNE